MFVMFLSELTSNYISTVDADAGIEQLLVLYGYVTR